PRHAHPALDPLVAGGRRLRRLRDRTDLRRGAGHERRRALAAGRVAGPRRALGITRAAPQTEMSRRVAGRRERAVRQVLAIVVVEARGAPAVAGVRFLRSLAAIEAAVGRAVERGGRIRRRALVTGIHAADDASPAHTRAAVRTVVAGRAAFRRDLERRGTGGV